MPKFIEWDGVYTPEQLAHITKLATEADALDRQGAVVDYLGFYDDEGWVELDTPPRRRFGVRSAAHCKVYKFPIVHANPLMAKATAEEFGGE